MNKYQYNMDIQFFFLFKSIILFYSFNYVQFQNWVQMLFFKKKTVGVAVPNAITLTTPLHFFEMVSGYLLVDGLFESALGSFDVLESDVSS